MSFLEVRGLRVGYGDLPVLQGIDFDVEGGQTTVLLGLNGAGKTTTVTTIAGLLKPSAGTITFDGARIDGLDPAQLVALAQVVARPRVDDRPLLHDEGGIGMAKDADVLLDDDHGDAVVVDALDDVEDGLGQ